MTVDTVLSFLLYLVCIGVIIRCSLEKRCGLETMTCSD